MLEAKGSRSGGVWGLARFVGHSAAADQWVRLVDMSRPLRAEARGLLLVRRWQVASSRLAIEGGGRRSGRVPGKGRRSAAAIAAWGRKFGSARVGAEPGHSCWA